MLGYTAAHVFTRDSGHTSSHLLRGANCHLTVVSPHLWCSGLSSPFEVLLQYVVETVLLMFLVSCDM